MAGHCFSMQADQCRSVSIPANVGLINIPHPLQLWFNETEGYMADCSPAQQNETKHSYQSQGLDEAFS